MNPVVRSGLSALLLVGTVAPLSADLRIRSVVEVVTERPREAGMLAQVAMILVPFRAAPGKADILTLVVGDAVRVEGLGPVLGLAPDVVFITKADGPVIGVVPSRSEYFEMPDVTPQRLLPVIGSRTTEKRHGPSEVMLGHQTERVMVSFLLEPKVPGTPGDQIYDGRTGRMVDAWTVAETPEQRSQRLARSEKSRNESVFHDPVTIESWESPAFGPAGQVAAGSRASMTWWATGGFSSTVESGFPLRQVIRNPTYGYRVESRVQSIESAPIDATLLEVPSHFRKVEPPPLRDARRKDR